MSKSEQVERAFDVVRADLGPYDILFNHAGTNIVKPLHDRSEEDYDRLMDINVRSEFLVCRCGLPEMVANGASSVVIAASIESELGFALEALYRMSRRGELQLARTINVGIESSAFAHFRLPGHRENCALPTRNRRVGRCRANVARWQPGCNAGSHL